MVIVCTILIHFGVRLAHPLLKAIRHTWKHNLDDVRMKGQTTVVRGSVVQQFEPFNPKVAQTFKKHLNLFFEWSKWNQSPNISTDNYFIAWVKHPKHSPRFDKQKPNIICTVYIYTKIFIIPRGLYQSHFMFHTLQIDKSKQQATNNDDSSKIVTKNRHAKVKSRRHSKNISNQKSLGIPTPSLSKSKQSIQFTRFLLFTSVCRSFSFYHQKITVGSCTKGGFRKESFFSRGSIFRLGG